MTTKSMVDICIRRARYNAVVDLYEHEIGRLAEEWAGSGYDMGQQRHRTAVEVETEIRSGHAMFYGAPVRCL